MSYLVFKTNRLVSILFTWAANLSYTVFLTNSLFTTLLSLLKSTGTVFNLSTSILSISAFRLAKSDFDAKLDLSTPVALLNLFLFFDAKLDVSTSVAFLNLFLLHN